MELEQSKDAELYLFLSVDIIDSTKKKYSGTPYNQNWTQFFYSFFKEFPDMFNGCLIDVTKKTEDDDLKKNILINPWKYAGDEILFYIKIEQKRQIPCIVNAFRNALKAWEKEQLRKLKSLNLDESNKTDIKGCIWIGQFPFIDKRFTYYDDNDKNNKKTDFIGPSIDCGFRLGKYASKRGIIVSVEIIDLCRDCSEIYNSIVFYKAEKLKGVGDMEYPIFNLLLNDNEINTIEKHIIKATQGQLEGFLENYYIENESKYDGRISRINKDNNEHLIDYLTRKTVEWDKKYENIELSDKSDSLPAKQKNKDDNSLEDFVDDTIKSST